MASVVGFYPISLAHIRQFLPRDGFNPAAVPPGGGRGPK